MSCIDKQNQRRNLLTFNILLLLTAAQTIPVLTILLGSCGGVTNLTCSTADIISSDDFRFSTLVPHGTTIYDQTQNGAVYMNKYSVTLNNGSFVLHINNTSESDNNYYSCNHNFVESNNVSLQIACPATPILTIVQGECGKVTTLTCSSGDIMASDPFTFSILEPLKMTIYDQTRNGAVYMNKYSVVSYNGSFILQIQNTSISDINKYSCNHNFLESKNVSLEIVCSQSGTRSTDFDSMDTFPIWLITVISLGCVIVLCVAVCLILYRLGSLNPLNWMIPCRDSQVSPSTDVPKRENNQAGGIPSEISPSSDISPDKKDVHLPKNLDLSKLKEVANDN